MPLKVDVVTAPMQRWGVDLYGPLLVSKNGNRYAILAQDFFSQRVEIFAIPDI